MLTTVYLIRHGDVDNPYRIIYGSEVDVRLSETGYKQIQILAELLYNKKVIPDIIYTSPLLRTQQSAKVISDFFNKTAVVTEARLLETKTVGIAGKPFSWIDEIGDVYNCPEPKDFSIETPSSIIQRMTSFLSEIIKEYQDKTIFIVGHGDPLAFTMWRLQNPKGNLPSIVELKKQCYLQKSETWQVVFDRKGKVVEYCLISPAEKQSK